MMMMMMMMMVMVMVVVMTMVMVVVAQGSAGSESSVIGFNGTRFFQGKWRLENVEDGEVIYRFELNQTAPKLLRGFFSVDDLAVYNALRRRRGRGSGGDGDDGEKREEAKMNDVDNDDDDDDEGDDDDDEGDDLAIRCYMTFEDWDGHDGTLHVDAFDLHIHFQFKVDRNNPSVALSSTEDGTVMATFPGSFILLPGSALKNKNPLWATKPHTPAREKSLYDKYGPWVMMGAIYIGTKWLGSYAKQRLGLPDAEEVEMRRRQLASSAPPPGGAPSTVEAKKTK